MIKFEAWIAQGWKIQGITNVIVTRTRDNGTADAGVFLVDSWCLGIKDAFLFENPPASLLQEVLDEQIPADTRERIHPACAKRFIDGAIAYADKLGFLPAGDFKKARKVLSGLDASNCDQIYTFGKDGKPCFVAGPDDTQERIDRVLRVLSSKLGADGYSAILPEPDEENDFDELADLDDEDDELCDDDGIVEVNKVDTIRDELRAFIEKGPSSWPTFESFLGLITAMQVSPKIVKPIRLLELLPGWGSSLFDDMHVMNTFIESFDTYWNSLADLIALEEDAGPNADSPIDLFEDEYDSPEALHKAHEEWAKGFCGSLTLFPNLWEDAHQREELSSAWATLSAWAAGDIPYPAGRRDHQKLDHAVLELYRALRKE